MNTESAISIADGDVPTAATPNMAGADEVRYLTELVDLHGFAGGTSKYLALASAGSADVVYRQIADPRCRAALLTLSIPDSARALAIEEGLGAVTVGLAGRCRQVVSVDDDVNRLHVRERWARDTEGARLQCVHVDRLVSLPFEDKSFDVVYLGRILDRLASGNSEASAVAPRALIAEVRRVLKADGQLYLSVCHPLDYHQFFDVPPARRVGRALNQLAGVLTRGDVDRDRSRPSRGFTRPALEALLSQNGFPLQTIYAPSPDDSEAMELALLEGGAAASGPRRSMSPIKSIVHKTAHHPSLFRHVASSFAVVAGAGRGGPTLLEEICQALDLQSDPLVDAPLRLSKTGTAIAHARTPTGWPVIVRIPLSRQGETGCERNARAIDQVQYCASLSEAVKRRVPALIGTTTIKGQKATAETLLKGATLGKKPDRRNKRSICFGELTGMNTKSKKVLAWSTPSKMVTPTSSTTTYPLRVTRRFGLIS